MTANVRNESNTSALADQFAHEFARLLGVSTTAAASATKALFRNGSEPRDSLPLDASETAELICGLENAMWREGWALLRDASGVYEIVRTDADRRFASDAEAIKHVESLAAMGPPLHEPAMRLHLKGDLEPAPTVRP